MWKRPSSIRRRDSNPRPLEHESSPITTRPGLPPYWSIYYIDNDFSFMTRSRQTNFCLLLKVKVQGIFLEKSQVQFRVARQILKRFWLILTHLLPCFLASLLACLRCIWISRLKTFQIRGPPASAARERSLLKLIKRNFQFWTRDKNAKYFWSRFRWARFR